MQITVTTWNINSVRFRIDLVAKFIKTARPDILCLQETKCPDDRFPRKRFKRLGYDNIALNGQKGYHGVVVLSRLPFEQTSVREFCGKNDCRHISITLGERAGLSDPITLHNLYVPAGGDVPDPAINAKFAHKLAFLDEMQACEMLRPAVGERSIIVGDLNVAPLECDVWSHKQLLSVVSHTPIECEKLARRAADRRLDRRGTNLCAGAGAALHMVELSVAGLDQIQQGPPPRPYLDVGHAGRPCFEYLGGQGLPQRAASFRPRAGDGNAASVSAAARHGAYLVACYLVLWPGASVARTLSISRAH